MQLARTDISVTELVSQAEMPEGTDSAKKNIPCINTRCERKRTGGVGVRAAGPWLPPHEQRLGNPAPQIAVCGRKAEGITYAGGKGSGAYMMSLARTDISVTELVSHSEMPEGMLDSAP